MTHEQRNAEVIRKIEAYTKKFAVTKKSAADALRREGFKIEGKKANKKISEAA